MIILIKVVILILGGVAGFLMLTHSYPLTQLFGHNSLAERYLGNGGTYTMWKLLGIIVLLGSLFYVFS